MLNSTPTTSLGRVDDNRGSEVKARREALGLSVRSLASLADVDRGRLAKFEEGETSPRDYWIQRVENALDRAEAEGVELSPGDDEPAPSGLIRFKVEGVYGAKALVVEGPVENLPELEEMVDRVMRRLAGEQDATDK